MTQETRICDDCGNEIEGETCLEGEIVLCADCYDTLVENIGRCGITLAHHLGISVLDVGDSDGNEFEINPHKTKDGPSPQEYVENVQFVRQALDILGIKADTQADLFSLFRPPAWKVRLSKWFKFVRVDSRSDAERVYYTLLTMLDANELTKAMKKEGIHKLVNTLWFILGNKNGDHGPQYIVAFNGETPKDTRRSSHTNDGEYLVLTDDEADILWDDELESYIDDCLLPELDENSRNYFDREKWKRDARFDGRGHSLNRYDGSEDCVHDEQEDEWYYIYRTN